MPENYEVIYSGNVLAEFKLLHSQARNLGLGQDFLNASQTIVERLAHSPLPGEPKYDLPNLQMVVWMVFVPPVVVHFGVNEERRKVFIKKFDLVHNN